MVVRTRAATETDADSIEALYQEFTRYLRTLGDETEAKLTADIYRRDGFGPEPAFYGLVAENDGEVIGYLLYHFGYDTEFAARVMYILDLFISEKHRKMGAGASLMEHAKTICRDFAVAEILWSVYKLNPSGREFYQGLGAKIIDDLDYMYLEVE